MKSYKPEDIVSNLSSMGHASKYETATNADGEVSSKITINTGRRVDAVLFLNDDGPSFRTFGKYKEEHADCSGDALKKYNNRQAMEVKRRLTGPVLAAVVAADAGGLNLAQLVKGFGLQAREGNVPTQDLDDDTPDQSEQRRSFKQPSKNPQYDDILF